MEFYRFEDDWQGKVREKTLVLLKETPCGYWIGPNKGVATEWYITTFGDKKRWVSKTTRKRYAYPTREEALRSYIHRKRRHIEILGWQLDDAKTRMTRAKAILRRDYLDEDQGQIEESTTKEEKEFGKRVSRMLQADAY